MVEQTKQTNEITINYDFNVVSKKERKTTTTIVHFT